MKKVKLYKDKKEVCYDIDIKSGVKSVTLYANGIELRNVKKTFPDVQTLVLGPNVEFVHISNKMFPNVRMIKSFSPLFMDGSSSLVLCTTTLSYHRERILYNTFCLNSNEVLNLSDITTIEDYAMDGCCTKDVVNVNALERCKESAFVGSVFEKEPLLFGGKVVNHTDKKLGIIDFSEIKCIRDNVDMSPLDGILVKSLREIDRLRDYFKNNPNVIFNNLYIKDAAIMNNLSCSWHHIIGSLPCLNINIINRTSFFSDNGILYRAFCGKRILWLCPRNRQGQIVIPDGVTHIGNGAFLGCKISTVISPDSLKHIEYEAFAYSQIQKIYLAHNLNTIGVRAFWGCKQLFDINLKDINLKCVEEDAFSGCINLQTVELPASLNFLGSRAFISTKEIKFQRFNNEFLNAVVDRVRLYTEKDNMYTKVICMGRTFYMPVFVSKNVIADLDLSQEDGELLYNKSISVRCKQETAIAVYKETGNNIAYSYLKRTALNIGQRLLKEDRESDFVDFIHLVKPSRSTLDKLLKIIDETDFVSAKAYVLSELKGTKVNFTL